MTSNVRAEKPVDDKRSEIFETCRPIVESICRRYLRRRHDIEDAIQDTFVKMIIHDMNATHPHRPGWVSVAAYTSCIDQIRREKSEQRRRLERSRMDVPGERRVEQREEQCRRIELALQRLDEPSRQLLMERYYRQTPLRLIADQIGVSLATISRRASAAQSDLAGIFENCELPDTPTM